MAIVFGGMFLLRFPGGSSSYSIVVMAFSLLEVNCYSQQSYRLRHSCDDDIKMIAVTHLAFEISFFTAEQSRFTDVSRCLFQSCRSRSHGILEVLR